MSGGWHLHGDTLLPFSQDDTSKEGAIHAGPTAGSQTARVLALIQQHGPVTDHELVALSGYPLATICARRGALMKQGYVGPADTVTGPRGAPNRRWRAVRG